MLQKRQARNEARLRQLLNDVEGNGVCADCAMPNPAWASYNVRGVHAMLINAARNISLSKMRAES